MMLSIIIVSYNTADLTVQTIESAIQEIKNSSLLHKQTEILVVDNHSHDDSVEKLKKLTKSTQFEIKLIVNTENLGFAQANNQAVTKARGKYILFLNSDTIVQPKSLEKMVESFEANPIDEASAVLETHYGKLDRLGILSPLLLQPSGDPQLQGGAFPSLGTILTHWLMLDDLPLIGKFFPSTQQKYLAQPRTPVLQYDWVPGTAMMVRRAVIDEVGSFDQNIFMYGEDVELCMRAKAHHWDIAIQQDAPIIHLGSASAGSSRAILGEIKGYLYIWAKHKPAWQMFWLKLILWSGCVIRRLLFGTMLRQPARAQIYAQAMQDVLR